MERKPLFRFGSLILLVLSFSAFAEPLSDKRQAELRNLLKQDCGSCHGMTLKGGLGPALTAEALKNKPIELITVTISEGRPGTPMPPWKFLLSEDDIHWLAQTLKQQVVAKQ
jgi:cytochrome c55X